MRDTLTGSRIRERRIARGLKQADLARAAGISASYLNLIEHNRRRIGGKLLLEISHILGVEPTVLTQGAAAAMVAGLREAAGLMPQSGAELDRVDEFAGRFPGWARLLTDTRSRIASLERMVEALDDRLAHDPHLATSLHEMLSTVTAIRSTATILAGPDDVGPDWQARFVRNIFEDSARLAETSRSLVTYLEAEGETVADAGTPLEEMHEALEQALHHIAPLEQGTATQTVLREMGAGLSDAARSLLGDWLDRYAADATALPLAQMSVEIARHGTDPAALSEALDADPARVMRRLAAMPPEVLPDPVGLAICDASGVLRYRKALPDFPMPRLGAACPLWPLYRALSRPMVILSAPLMQAGRPGEVLQADAVALPRGRIAVQRDPVFEATMLLRPARREGEAGSTESVQEVGVTCRICPRAACDLRREPSVVSGS